MKKIAVTGGSGFIGSAVVKRVESRGWEAIIIDRANGRDILGDEGICLLKWLDGVDSVIHLAGVLGTSELFDNPDHAVDVNIKGTLRVLRACRETGTRYVGITMPECWPNVYQATRNCARMLAQAWHHNFGVPTSHVRAYNAYGIGQKYGPGHPQKIIPTFASLAWEGKPIPIWGDGEQKVDLVHVNDIARMLVDATFFGNGEIFDAGTGQPMTVNLVAELVFAAVGTPLNVQHLPMRLGEVPTDATYARGEGWPLLDWRPTFNSADLCDAILSYRRTS